MASTHNAFGDLEAGAISTGAERPFQLLDFDKEDDVLNWLKTEIAFRKDKSRERIVNIRKNIAVFRGIQYSSTDPRTREEAVDKNVPRRRARNPRVIFNHMVDMVEQDVARSTKFRGAISATPASEDEKDRATAKVAEILVEKLWEKLKFDKKQRQHVRRKKLAGDDFFGVFWNKNAGPYSISWVAHVFKMAGIEGDPRKMTSAEIAIAFRDKVKEIPKMPHLDSSTGEQMRGRDGKLLWIDKPVRRGEVEYRLISAADMFLERVNDYSKVREGTFQEWVHIEVLRAMHPEFADDLKDISDEEQYDFESCDDEKRPGYVRVYHTFAASMEFLDQGRYIKWCDAKILVSKPNPYRGWDNRAILPWARTPDVEAPDCLHADSLVTYGRQPHAVYNNLISMDVRNQFLYAHPKWAWPKGSVKIESAGNDVSVMQFKGPIPPQLIRPQLGDTGSEALKERSMADMQKIMAVYGVSRGDPPGGVTAAVALQFLDEQENERSNVGVADLTDTQKEVAQMSLWLMADYYHDDEGRLIELVGKTKADLVKYFKMADLRNIADISIQNASALPQQKSARTQYLLDIRKEAPEAMPTEVFIDLLGLAEQKRLQTIVTVAVRKADEENDSMMHGKKPEAPQKQEYHLAHYRAHRRQMNEPWYVSLSKERQGMHVEHVMAHEMEMASASIRNPAYLASVLREFPDFPVFYKGPESKAIAALLASQLAGPSPAPGGAMPPPPMPPEAVASEMPLPPGAESVGPSAPAGIAPGAESMTQGGMA